jgi:hypothetical protein
VSSESVRGRDDCDGLSPRERLRIIGELWNEIRIDGDFGAADQVAVEEIERAVTEEMYRSIPDVNRAESLTFKALHLIAGNIDSTST